MPLFDVILVQEPQRYFRRACVHILSVDEGAIDVTLTTSVKIDSATTSRGPELSQSTECYLLRCCFTLLAPLPAYSIHSVYHSGK